jgi:hypothetical protein
MEVFVTQDVVAPVRMVPEFPAQSQVLGSGENANPKLYGEPRRTCGVEKKGGVPAHGAVSASASKLISSPYDEQIPRTEVLVLFLSGPTGFTPRYGKFH